MALGCGVRLAPLWSPRSAGGRGMPLPAALPRQDLDGVTGGNLSGR